MTTSNSGEIEGALRLSKGAWLFAPDGSECLWRVKPVPAPDEAGFFSKRYRARLTLTVDDVRQKDGKPSVTPTTAIPAKITGTLQAAAGGAYVCGPPGVVFWLDGAKKLPAAGGVEVDVDVAGGVVCQLLSALD